MRRKSVSAYVLVILLGLFLTVPTQQRAVAQEEYPAGELGQQVRDKIANAWQQGERLSGGPEAIGKPYTLVADDKVPQFCKRHMGSVGKMEHVEVNGGGSYTFYYRKVDGDKVFDGVLCSDDSAGRNALEIKFYKGRSMEAIYKRDGKWDGFVWFHRSGKVAKSYAICNEMGDMVRGLEWNDQGKLISDKTFDEPVVFFAAASPEDEARVKAAVAERDRKAREEAAKQPPTPTPTPKPLTPVEDARQYAAQATTRDPDVVIAKFQALIDAEPGNPENFFHEVEIINCLIAPGPEPWQSEKQNRDAACERIRKVIEKYPDRKNNIQMLFLWNSLAIEESRKPDGYAEAAKQFDYVLDFPQDQIVVSPPTFIQFPLPPEEAEHMKTEHPEEYQKREKRWKELIDLLRVNAAGNYCALENRHGGLPAAEQLATQRPSDVVFQKTVQRELAFYRQQAMKSAQSEAEDMAEDIGAEPPKP